MVVYIPTDNTQSTEYDAVALKAQVQEYQAFGPSPRNYYTARGTKGMIYADHSVSNQVTSISAGATRVHPCSDAGLKASPRPTFGADLTFERPSSPGFFDPPIQYIPPQVKWKYHSGGWESALAEQLAKKGIQVSAAQVTTRYNSLVSDPKDKKEPSHCLYHPADRSTAIFKGEPAASLVARWVRANGIDWDRIYDTHNRPPIYARWPTGEQAVCEPVVLMCLPKPESFKGRESYHKDVDWYGMDPAPKSPFETMWTNMWKTYDIKKDMPALAKEFGFPTVVGLVPFMWTLVVLHRRIAMDDQILDKDLGSWIEQYGAHLIKCGRPYKPRQFDFNKSKPYTGRKITYHELTGWILNPRFGDGTVKKFAQRFDDAIEALIGYNIDLTNAKWAIFKAKMKTANTPP